MARRADGRADKSDRGGRTGVLPEEARFDFTAMLSVADALPMPIAYLDTGRRYRFINRAFADFFERPRSTILGLTVEELLGPEIYAVRKPMFDAAFAGERQWFAAEFPHPTRGPLAMQAEYVPQINRDGRVVGVVALVQDVTEQRATEAALRESEARFRRIANQAPVLMWVTRVDRVRDFVNDAYVEFTGVSHEDARTLDWRTRIHADDQDRIVAESIAGEAGLKQFTLEGRYLRGDGQYRWLRSTSSPRFGPDGELLGFIGAATDITLAKEAELELKRQVEERTAQLALSEAQFRAVFEAALEVMVLLQPDGTVIAVNDRREIWRYPHPEESIGRKLWDAPTMRNYPQHIPILKAGILKAARGEVFTTEVKMEREGVPTAYLDVSVQPVRNDGGKIVYLLFEARDVTELKIAQEQLRQSQKMEALGQLTGGIAHDFNNLLTVVVGGLDQITRRVEEPKIKTYAENALNAAERGARLTGQLLAFSRVQRLEVRPTLVAPLIENMRPLLRNVLGPGIRKKFELVDDRVPVMADPTQLELAVLNLAINARDAMPDGGVLTFRTEKTRIVGDQELADGDYIELSIADTGVGMDDDVRFRAFEPFFTTKEVGKGTGLGLSMVYGVARQSGGTARIRSTPGEGTCVSLYFRCSGEGETEGAEISGGADSPRRRSRASVLVIDDDPDVREFIAETLAELGYAVRTADGGEAGLAEFAQAQPDVIILDYVMPGLSGAEVASRILAEEPNQPILFVSGYSETEAIRAIAPRAPLLAKPFRAEALDQAVRKAMRVMEG